MRSFYSFNEGIFSSLPYLAGLIKIRGFVGWVDCLPWSSSSTSLMGKSNDYSANIFYEDLLAILLCTLFGSSEIRSKFWP